MVCGKLQAATTLPQHTDYGFNIAYHVKSSRWLHNVSHSLNYLNHPPVQLYVMLSHKNNASLFCTFKKGLHVPNTFKLTQFLYHHKLRGRESERVEIHLRRLKYMVHPPKTCYSYTKRVYLVAKNSLRMLQACK